MIGTCPKCGNYDYNKQTIKNKQTIENKQAIENKQIIENMQNTENKQTILCQQCGHQWDFKSLPLFVLTGCSGVGKTTTAQELIRRDTNFIVLDADFLFNIMPHDTEEDYKNWVEQILSLSKNIMQGGKPILWTIAGALDYFESSYSRRFFSDIHFLALVCNSEDLEKRMREGRQITDSNWIQSSIDYNRWFIENGIVADQRIDTCDITGKSVSDVADYVMQWIDAKF